MKMAAFSWFFLFHLSLTISLSISTDESTLIALKNHIATANPHHFLLQNWSRTTSVCNWTGITCNITSDLNQNYRVTAVKISNMQLQGTIPSSLLGNISSLISLDFSSNNFYGNLPQDLAVLPRLREINFFNNSFSGFIPSSYSNISELERLILGVNELEGNIPQQFGNLTNLKGFYGGRNRLTGGIPSEFGNLRMLQYLYIGNNTLQGQIPKEISNLENLQALVLSYNSLSGSIPAGIFNISTLKIISMIKNNLSGTLPSTLGLNLPNLANLNLEYNQLTGKIPDSISNASQLFHITLQANKLTGSIPNSLGNLKLLECLHLYGNELTNDAPDRELSFLTALTNCPKLRDLSVSFNPLGGFLPPSIGNLSTTLMRLHLSGCMITGKIPDEIGNLSYVNRLNLPHNDLSGFIPSTIRGLRRLQGLFIRNNRLQGSLPDTLCEMSQLSDLGLGQNQISGPIPQCIGNVTSLRSIDLSLNRLDSKLPLSLWNLKDVLKLDLSSNSLTGDLPLEIQNLKKAYYINLSKNDFTGVIPDAYGSSMQDLSSFSLASNKLEGSIPRSFGDMISLVSLDLSDNALSGEIPKELEGLKHLTYFNASFNKLSGEIPSGGPFKNFNYLLFASNEALCGAPQLRVPRCHDSSSRSKKRRTMLVVIVSVVTGCLTLMALLVLSWIIRRTRKADVPETGDDISFDQNKAMERFSYQQLKQATGDFSKGNLLGSGSFGSVYLADFHNGNVFAVKVFDLKREYASRSFETECEMLSKLRHRNLTKVISACSNLEFKALLLEYMQNGSLEDWLYGDGYFLDVMQRINVMIDVASALEYLHHGYVKPVIHCDLKPSNILLDRELVGHVTDFGITKLLGEEQSIVHTQTLATLGYMAPEYGIEGLVSSACDVYSYGILLMETFTRKKPCDDMFGAELSLRSWVQSRLPDSVPQIVDSTLMKEDGKHFAEKVQCFLSIFELALACTVESPKSRMKIKDVLTALEKIKLQLISTSETANA